MYGETSPNARYVLQTCIRPFSSRIQNATHACVVCMPLFVVRPKTSTQKRLLSGWGFVMFSVGIFSLWQSNVCLIGDGSIRMSRDSHRMAIVENDTIELSLSFAVAVAVVVCVFFMSEGTCTSRGNVARCDCKSVWVSSFIFGCCE